MTKEQWNKAIDSYVIEQNQKKGKPFIIDPSVPSSFPQAHEFVSFEAIRDYAVNIGDSNPLYTDREYAKKTRWGGVIAPPGRFVNYIAETGSFARGNVVDGMNFLYGGTDYEMFDVIHEGDTFTISDEFIGIDEKKLSPEKAEKYRLFSYRAKRNYINQKGAIVVSVTGNVMITAVYPDNKKDDGSAVFNKVNKPSYSDEDLEKLYTYYDEYNSGKYTRGNNIRYWEEVNVGDRTDVLIKGPNDVTDMAAFICAVGGTLGNSATKWASLKPLHIERDPDTRAWLSRDAFHYSDLYALSGGLPRAMVYGALMEAYMCEAISDWCGDDAFVKSISIQQRKPAFHGDILYISGIVEDKFIDEGRHYAKLKFLCTNQNEQQLCTASTVIELISKSNEKR